MLQAPPVEKLTFSYMEEAGFSESLIQANQADVGFYTSELSPQEQASQILRECSSLSERDHSYLKDKITTQIKETHQISQNYDLLRGKYEDQKEILRNTENQLNESRILEEKTAQRLIELEESGQKLRDLNSSAMQELTNLKSQIELEQKMRQHSDSVRTSKKRNSGYMKYVSKRSGNIQPLYGINFDEDENQTKASSEKVENPKEDLPEEFIEMRQPSLSADQELLIGSLEQKYTSMKEENFKLREDYVVYKEKAELLQNGCKQLEKYNEDLKKQNLDTQKELETRDNRIKYLETRFKYLKDNCDKKDKEILQYKNEMKKMKSAQVFENNVRRNTELIEEQMKERLGAMVAHNRSGSTKMPQKSAFGEDIASKKEPRNSLAGVSRGRVQQSGDSTPQNMISRSSSESSHSQQNSSFNPPGSQGDLNPVELSLDSQGDSNILIKHARNPTRNSLAFQMDNVVPQSDEESHSADVSKNLTAQKSDLSMNDLQSQEGLNNFNLGAQIFDGGPFDVSKPASYIPPGYDIKGQEYLRVSTLKNWSPSDADLKSFFVLNLLICKSDYPDFDNYAEIDPNQIYERMKESEIEPIQYLHYAKEKVRYVYREAKLKANNIEPTKFAFRLWTLKDIVKNQYLEEPDILRSFFYPKSKGQAREEEEKEREMRFLKGSIHQVQNISGVLMTGGDDESQVAVNSRRASEYESDQ